MRIEPFYDNDTATWSYVLADEASSQAAIIDPVLGLDPGSGRTSPGPIQPLLDLIAERGWQLRWVLETHAHADHLTAARYVKRQTGASVGASAGIIKVAERFSRVFNLEPIDVAAQFDVLLREGDHIELGGVRIRVMDTPGHTDDSITYIAGDAAFVGDTLFQPDFGTARCDFPGGDAGRLYDSIQKLFALPDTTRLFVGHDYPPSGRGPRCETTVAESRRNNIQVNAGIDRERFIAAREARDAELPVPRLLLPALQVNIRAGRLPDPEDNGYRYFKLPLDMDIAGVALGRN